MTDEQLDPNDHIRKYLDYYLKLPRSPGYAVLVNGPWGIGKTHIVKAVLAKTYGDLEKPAYVSLYGLSSTDQIDQAVAHAVFPFLKSNTSKLAGQAARAVAGVFRLKTEMKAEELVNSATAPVYIFDDLERAEMPLNEVLGYINRFVEHDGQKVIILADEDRIEDEKYSAVREKLIGQSLTAHAVAPDALAAFIADMASPKAKRALQSRTHLVLDIFEKSEVANLRILQHAVRQFDRLFVALSDAHVDHSGVLDAVVGLIFPLIFELRSDRMKPSDLENRLRSQQVWGNADTSPMRAAFDRYEGHDIYTQVLTDEVVKAVLIDGLVDTAMVRSSVDQSSFFASASETPAWQIVWLFHMNDQVAVQNALDQLDQRFEEGTLADWSEILHVFAIKIWRARHGFSGESLEEAKRACLIYIESLRSAGKLPKMQKREMSGRLGTAGYELMDRGDEVRELLGALQDAVRQAKIDTLPSRAEELLGLMKSNSALFAEKISFRHGVQPEFFDMPVLSAIDGTSFFRVFIELPPASQHDVLAALHERATDLNSSEVADAERAWMSDLREAITVYADAATGIERHRLNQLVEWNFKLVPEVLEEER